MRFECAGVEFYYLGGSYICEGPNEKVLIETRHNPRWKEMDTMPMCWYLVVGGSQEARKAVLGPYTSKIEAKKLAIQLVSE
jgi:hypothetical protein